MSSDGFSRDSSDDSQTDVHQATADLSSSSTGDGQSCSTAPGDFGDGDIGGQQVDAPRRRRRKSRRRRGGSRLRPASVISTDQDDTGSDTYEDDSDVSVESSDGCKPASRPKQRRRRARSKSSGGGCKPAAGKRRSKMRSKPRAKKRVNSSSCGPSRTSRKKSAAPKRRRGKSSAGDGVGGGGGGGCGGTSKSGGVKRAKRKRPVPSKCIAEVVGMHRGQLVLPITSSRRRTRDGEHARPPSKRSKK